MTVHLLVAGVTLAYDGRAAVLADVDLHLRAGWTGVVGANGAGKTTLLRLLAGELPPTRGAITREPADATTIVCAQRVDVASDEVRAFADDWARVAQRWRARLDLDPDGLDRWPTLSPGERRRWQLGAALAAEPDVLLLDEPTNHLDAPARARVIEALTRHRGVGVVVSHDRALLDALTTTTVRVADGGARAYAGGWTAARPQWEAEEAARRDAWQAAATAQRRGERQLVEARVTAAAASRAVSARARIKGPRDADGRSMGAKNLASWAAARAGREVGKLRDQAEAAADATAALALTRARGREVVVDWEPPPRRWLASFDGPLVAPGGGGRVLAPRVRVTIERGSRVHLAGANGRGKSTLLAALVAACTLPADRVLWLPQELSAAAAAALAREIAALDDTARGRLGQLAAALGLDPARATASGQPSPGEARKLAIALGLARRAWLVVLDEPTNHLDLPAVERLERALAAYPGALVLATHDAALAARLTTERIDLDDAAGGDAAVTSRASAAAGS